MNDERTLSRTRAVWTALGGADSKSGSLAITGEGNLPSAFAVTDLAAASVGAAGLALAELVAALHGTARTVTVDRRSASFWFSSSLRPQGWALPPLWDSVAGDYATQDGWIRLHTNAPHHRAAAQRVLGSHQDRAAMAAAVALWSKSGLESAVVAEGGCAAEMRSMDDWKHHPAGQAVAAEPLVMMQASAGSKAASWASTPARPLKGLRVLDLTRVLAGPTATRFLAGYGADVLRLDPDPWNEPGVIPEMTLGKRCARLDLATDAGRRTFEALLAKADVMISGYRSDALERLGFGDAARRAIAPGLVDIRLDAYGWTGPWNARRGFDSLVQMSCGIAAAGMEWRGADKPHPLPVQALDHATGYLVAAAALRGLAGRVQTGAGFSARLSLARTAELLMGWGREPQGAPPAPESDADIAPAVENTDWGPARRLVPPLAISGAPMNWNRPARDLGTALPCWE